MALNRLAEKWRPLLQRAFETMAASELATPRVLSDFSELLDHVAFWTNRAGLTDAREPEELVDEYVAHASMLAKHRPPSLRTWVELEAGGGARGLSLALLVPEVRVTLVDSRSHRVAFLRTLGSALSPGRTEALLIPVERLQSRAWEGAIHSGSPDSLENEGARLAQSSAWVFPSGSQEPAAQGWSVAADISYALPLTQAPRRVVHLLRTSPAASQS